MTSLRQLEANRRNALRSTGPRTENGKQQSRRNALKHGLTAETVIEPLENPEEYRVFEEAVVSEYLPQTPVVLAGMDLTDDAWLSDRVLVSDAVRQRSF